MLSGFLTLNAQNILPHAGNKGISCYKVKVEESEKADLRRESNPGYLWLEPPVLCHCLSGRALETQARAVLDSSPGDCWPRLKPELSWVRLPVTASLFTFLYFRPITYKFLYFQREARCSEQHCICSNPRKSKSPPPPQQNISEA